MMQEVNDQNVTDRVLEALAHQYRRNTLCFLAAAERDAVSLEDVSEELASSSGPPVEDIKASLHHNHLPKLEEAGFVEYDERSGTIRSGNSELISNLRKIELLDCTVHLKY